MKHKKSHPLAGHTVLIKKGKFKDASFRIEDWWDILDGRSWGDAQGNPAAMQYALRGAADNLPMDDEVVYGKIGILGHLVHVSEFE